MHILPALPEETLFSRCVRTRDVNGMTAEQFFRSFLNNTAHSLHPSLTTSLNTLTERTAETGHELWLNQTLVPLYAWALPEYRAELEDLTVTAARLHTLCKLCRFTEHYTAVLKHCPVCVYGDIRKYGVAYWHRQHQIAGVTSCHHHQVNLNHIADPRLSSLHLHFPYNREKMISLSGHDDFEFAKFTASALSLICQSAPGFVSYGDSPLIAGFLHRLSAKNDPTLFEKINHLASRSEKTCKALFPVRTNMVSQWKALLYNPSPQPPARTLLLLFCLHQLNLG
ncbi:TniQ family protein [Enterobacter bugandensis]|uniref:TniQ family protein n=1 Tax=Enterobacter bugandensis TaxID=881260 RepID=UPI002A8292E6|nr:TniQ family protein [Enterobacter bugandensis]